MKNIYSLIILLMSVLLASCSAPVKEGALENNWPGDIPQYGYYEQLYLQDEDNQTVQTQDDYLTWVKRFFKGWIGFAKGWHDVSQQIVENVPTQDHDTIRDQLADMGKRVSGEWAKKSKKRLIYTKDLAIWGDALSEALYHEQILETVQSIDRDINALLNKEITSNEITMDRYFSDQNVDQEFSMY